MGQNSVEDAREIIWWREASGLKCRKLVFKWTVVFIWKESERDALWKILGLVVHKQRYIHSN